MYCNEEMRSIQSEPQHLKDSFPEQIEEGAKILQVGDLFFDLRPRARRLEWHSNARPAFPYQI